MAYFAVPEGLGAGAEGWAKGRASETRGHSVPSPRQAHNRTARPRKHRRPRDRERDTTGTGRGRVAGSVQDELPHTTRCPPGRSRDRRIPSRDRSRSRKIRKWGNTDPRPSNAKRPWPRNLRQARSLPLLRLNILMSFAAWRISSLNKLACLDLVPYRSDLRRRRSPDFYNSLGWV